MSICIFGASSTWGAWDLEKGGWANRLRLFLDAGDYDVETYNLGISGDTTNELLDRFDVETAAREPKIIIFSIGGNDSYLVPIDQFGNNVEKLIKKAKTYTERILFLGIKRVDETKTNPVPWNENAFYTNAKIEVHDKKLKEVAEKNNAAYLSLADVITADNLNDGLHPNEQGREKIFNAVKEFLCENKWL